MAPLIAVAPCRALPDYLESVHRAGGEARTLDRAADTVDDVMTWCRGLLLTGGVDIDPARYGEPRHPGVLEVDPDRDEYELALTRRALDADLPVLAICRGLQVLNVAGGGTLVQDIPDQVPGAAEHSVRTPLYAVAHEVWLTKGSVVWTLMREELHEGDAISVNSRHHQGVQRVADGFEVVGTAPDGVIEALERRGARFCVGVQWHPENFWRTGEFRPLFEGFVEACR